MPKGPGKEKKNSGPGGSGTPLNPAHSSASSIQQDSLQASDFMTGRVPGAPAGKRPPGAYLPAQKDIDLKKYPHMKAAHLQVVPESTQSYGESWQARDEKVRRQHRLHPRESLMSVNNRLRKNQKWSVNGLWLPHLEPAAHVDRKLTFNQMSIEGAGQGICTTLCYAFMLFRCMEMECAHILSEFRDRPRNFLALDQMSDEHFKAREWMFEFRDLSCFESTNYQFFERNFFTIMRPYLRMTSTVRTSLPYLAPVGHFEFSFDKPGLRANLGSKLAMVSATRMEEVEVDEFERTTMTARGVEVDWTVPRRNEFLSYMPPEERAPREIASEQVLHPQFGAHLFADMIRQLKRAEPNRGTLESFPFFTIEMMRKGKPGGQPGHMLFVEFNVVKGQITTAKGIFDPNYGWIKIASGFCPHDFDLLLSGLFFLYEPEAIIAYQLRCLTTGVSSNPAYVAEWGGRPWTNVD